MLTIGDFGDSEGVEGVEGMLVIDVWIFAWIEGIDVAELARFLSSPPLVSFSL